LSVPIHLPPPAEPAEDTAAGLLNCQIAEISRDLRNTFPENLLWEEAVFPAAAVLKCVGAFRNMYRALLHVSAVTTAQRRQEVLQNKPHPTQPTAAEYDVPIPPERIPTECTRRSSESKLP
ncbi:hypothetical protein PTTG_09040, partial [Puccinia triticina 1-1 BBBD Race 1]|uniref:Uncharacterized protein n=1 Tax=Puccinia triticina (isolate 1-1 / race 1 (BBBD)) TaxID=630390 RepID=A0A0C4F7B1_PUCT1